MLLLSPLAILGHGSLVIPQTRNAIDRFAPQWKFGYPTVPDFPGTGRWGLPNETCGSHPPSCQEGCSCSNGTEACDVGQSCFWFSSGCTIGCDVCDGDGRRDGDPCRCGQCANATLNKPEYRTTGNRSAVPGSAEDWTKFNPWRSPGRAPTFDACGMAGGGPVAGVESGEYNQTAYAKQGDLGSQLPATPTGTVWKAGGLGLTGWYIRANHGGGYQYRLCPKGEELTEACFQRTPLEFVAPQWLRWDDGHTEEIEGTYVTEGVWPEGSMWAMNPLPQNPTDDFRPPCKAGTSPAVRAPMAVGQYGHNPGPCAGNWPTTVNIMDNVRVPADIEPGEWVLSWRWDCELTAQVWNACSDITIVAADA